MPTLIAKTKPMSVQTARGPVIGWYERYRHGPALSHREFEVAVGESPFGAWRAQQRELHASHIYTYPHGSTATNNAAIRRLVGKMLEAWSPSAFASIG